MTSFLPEYFEVNQRLVSTGGLNRGEIGGMDTIIKANCLEDALYHVRKYPCLKDSHHKSNNIYDPYRPKINYRDYDNENSCLVHLHDPKIYTVNLRFGHWMLRPRQKCKIVENEGDEFFILAESFDLKKREVNHYQIQASGAQDAFDRLKKNVGDTKKFLFMNARIYSKKLYIPDVDSGGKG